MDKKMMVWNAESLEKLGEFTQHRDTISSVRFRLNSYDLYSCSFDRTIKVWNIQEMSYVETLFGHQDQIMYLHALSKEQCLTCGSRDRTVRLWKIPEESQLVFRGGGGLQVHQDLVVMQEWNQTEKKRMKDDGISGGSIDVCLLLEDGLFVSGTDSG
jgi:ribosomal RNA-processing protein 9